MYELTTIVDFEAAHRLADYPGKCSRLHGHNWRVEVTVAGAGLDGLGMLIDFRILKQEVTRVIETLDHYYLNEIEPFRTVNPTAENIAAYVYRELAGRLPAGVAVQAVKVWESPHSAAVYREG
ncbi:6-carboxytetrahydropterin synthase QueD [Anaeroselena agilis]|uniref:6-carboxy-5,6,7,8-tetrahydropterin synthase n=1 Tax=Anaeroselena agilis TaxID=3063788 RepID=A0ABU3NXC8_9FIRM|nr:6-carboxytetrahydropterin synthase QueD [Selenomonadales bacterium 4137-cl]